MPPTRTLAVLRTPVAVPPADRGRLLNAAEVAALLFAGKVSKKWVFANVPHYLRHRVGRLVLYYEGEVRVWMETLREQVA